MSTRISKLVCSNEPPSCEGILREYNPTSIKYRNNDQYIKDWDTPLNNIDLIKRSVPSLNTRLMVEHGTAVEVVLNDSGRFKREEVAKAIKMVVLEKTGEGMRSKAIELSSKMKDEAEIGMNETSEQLLQLCIKYKQKQ